MKAAGKEVVILLSVAAMFIAAYFASRMCGSDAASGCRAAIIASSISSLCGLVPVMYALNYKPDYAGIAALASTIIRLVLVLIVTAVVLFVLKINAMWYLGWLGLFYIALLVVESLYVVSRMKLQNR